MNLRTGLFLVALLLLISCRATDFEPTLNLTPPPASAHQTLAAFEAAEPPARDIAALAARLRGISAVPEPPVLFTAGDSDTFYYEDENDGRRTATVATLRLQTDALNMWVEDGARVREAALRESAAIIERDILPVVRDFFGPEAQPGIDGDPRLSILHLRNVGGDIAGYFSAADLVPRTVDPTSNQREMLNVNLRRAALGSEAYFGVIAHELQHLIQAQTDQNELTWVDEGMAELAAYLTGFSAHDHLSRFGQLTDVSLTQWSYTDDVSGHYAASFLFSLYFLDRFSATATRLLTDHPENGAAGFDATLAEIGESLDFESLFADWLVANYLNGRDLDLSPYGYANAETPVVEPVATLRTDALSRNPLRLSDDVAQFGADYVRLQGSSPATLIFTGTQQVSVLPVQPASGAYLWSTVPADRSDMTLTRAVDLSGVTSAELTFRTWYAIEEDWDYGYVQVSTDDGQTWDLLATGSMTTDNPRGNNWGVGLTGYSDSWRTETADLTPYAGRPVLLRFNYITDDAVHEAGWAIDDIAISGIDFSDDAEGDAGWEAAGWVRHANVLPQRFLLQAVLLGEDQVRVMPLPLDAMQQGAFRLPLDANVDEAIVVIAGLTPVTEQRAAYTLRLQP